MKLRRVPWTVPLAGLAVMAAPLPHGTARAQNITVDGRLSAAQTLAGPDYRIGAELGQQRGGNLFHSFGRFGLNAGESATFAGPASVNNVIGRVTGGAASSIDGTVRSAIPGANLYLINPAGVVFGPNARVDVSGSFHASSADYLRLRDGARFQATNPDAGTLSAAPPEAFGFLSASPRPVTVSGATLRAPPGGALGLVGGPVTVSGGSAASGRRRSASPSW
jgi:filamentous hemagglutinin family protein